MMQQRRKKPHGISIALWNEVIARVFRTVRSIDTKHYIIVGGADWNSFAGMTQLPPLPENAPVFCGEFGCFAPFAKHEERVNWYRIVTNLLEERGIARTSWGKRKSLFGDSRCWCFGYKRLERVLL